jgi:ubiquinone/menaquinone biosynthesis C-methylase UbiE
MFLILLDEKLWLAPIETPKRILDIGTGTGIWYATLVSISAHEPY